MSTQLMYFTSGQKRGIFLLIVLISLIVLLRLAQSALFQDEIILLVEEVPAKEFYKNSSNFKSKIPTQIIKVNSADSLAWVSLPGIGPVLSKRIMKFRESVGGFHSLNQIAKVYGVKPETFEKILPFLELDPGPVKQKSKQYFNSEKKKEAEPIWMELNRATAEELKQIKGIGNVLSERIVKYRDAKGGFQKLEEIGEVYGIKPELLAELRKQLYVDSSLVEKREEKFVEAKPKEKIDLNLADSVALISVYGIGPKLSARILKYRDELGFFLSVDQLKEIWGMREENYLLFVDAVKVTEAHDLPQISINFIDIESFAGHPYVSWSDAKIIVKYREMHGSYESMESLQQIHGIEQSTWEKLIPYLLFE